MDSTDFSAMYLHNLGLDMPCGAFIHRRAANGFRAERALPHGLKATEWIEYMSRCLDVSERCRLLVAPSQ